MTQCEGRVERPSQEDLYHNPSTKIHIKKERDLTALKIPVEVTRLMDLGEIVNGTGNNKDCGSSQWFPNLSNLV